MRMDLQLPCREEIAPECCPRHVHKQKPITGPSFSLYAICIVARRRQRCVETRQSSDVLQKHMRSFGSLIIDNVAPTRAGTEMRRSQGVPPFRYRYLSRINVKATPLDCALDSSESQIIQQALV